MLAIITVLVFPPKESCKWYRIHELNFTSTSVVIYIMRIVR